LHEFFERAAADDDRLAAFENASLAEKRVAKKRSPRTAFLALRAWYLASSCGPSTFSAKRGPLRASAASTREIWTMSVPMP
jgi:hypothetical protein